MTLTLDDPNTVRDIKHLVSSTEDFATLLVGALKESKDALYHVTDLVFDDEMARYDEDGKMLPSAAECIKQYHGMVARCENALSGIAVVLLNVEASKA